MNGAMGGVLRQSTQMKCLIHHTLSRKCCVTMNENTHHLGKKKGARMLAFPNTSSSLTTSWICPRRGISWFNSLAVLVQNQVACLPPVGIVNLSSGFDFTLKAVFAPIKIKRSCCSFVIHPLTAAKDGMNGNGLKLKKEKKTKNCYVRLQKVAKH